MRTQAKVLCLGYLLLASAASAELHFYTAIPLTGAAEVPPVNSLGHGVLTAVYDDSSNLLHYRFAWNLASAANNAHFHGPASLEESAGVRVDLGPVSGQSGEKRGTASLTEEQEAELLDGLWYLNVHSVTVPSGEVRGQLLERTLSDTLSYYDTRTNTLHMNSVVVPGIGVFEVEAVRIEGRSPLSVEVSALAPKDYEDDDTGGEPGEESPGPQGPMPYVP